MALAEDSAQGSNMNPEIALLDERIRPDARDQLFLRHDLAGPFG
jgi:hypothetical protein